MMDLMNILNHQLYGWLIFWELYKINKIEASQVAIKMVKWQKPFVA